MERGAAGDFLARLAETDPSAAPHAERARRPADAEWPAWSGPIREALDRLGRSRPLGALGGAGPIPFGEIDAYARRYAVVGEDFDRFARLIETLDRVLVEHLNGKARESQNRGQGDKG